VAAVPRRCRCRVGVAACHTPVVVPLGQHPHLPLRAVARRLGGGAGNIETPPSRIWSEGGGCRHRKRTDPSISRLERERGCCI
jgi:hypothetical protein